MVIEKTKTAVLWSMVDAIIRQGGNFCISIILAHLLMPSDFGTLALLSIFFGVAAGLADAGFSEALVQKKNINIIEESTIFWFNCGFGALCSVILWSLSTVISEFYRSPILVSLTEIMAINIFIVSSSSVQNALLRKKMDFRRLTIINITSMIISSSVAVAMAWNDFGVWALVGKTLTSSIVTSTMLGALTGWRPEWQFSFNALRSLFGFGGYIFASSLLHNIFINSYSVVIGRFFPVANLGYYQLANGLSDSLSSLLNSVVSRVSFPLLSNMANDAIDVRRSAGIILRGTMLIHMPAMVGLSLIADNLVLTLYGEKWLFAIPYLQILAIAGLFLPINSINLIVLLSFGNAKKYFYLEILKKCNGIFCLLFGAFYWGVLGVAWATLILNIINAFIDSYFTKKLIGYGLIDQINDILPIAFICSLMALVVHFVETIITTHPDFTLFLQVIIGITCYFLLLIYFNLNAYAETLKLAKSQK